MKKLILFLLLFPPCLILISCADNNDNSQTQGIVYIAPEHLADVKVQFQDENGSSEGDLTLNSDGSIELYQISGWISSNYFGSYVYERHGAEEGVIYASYNLVETNVGGSLVSESTDLAEQYILYFNDLESGNFSRSSGSGHMDGTFMVVDIE